MHKTQVRLKHYIKPLFHRSWTLQGNLSASPYLANGPSDILINGVGDLCSLHTCFELHGEHAWVVPEPPVVCLVTSQTRAVDPGLLAGSNTYDLKHIDTKHHHALLSRDHNQSCIPAKPLGKTSHKLAAPH